MENQIKITADQIKILNENLKGTNWADARIENWGGGAALVASHNGEAYYGHTAYRGVYDFPIAVRGEIYNATVDYGVDQHGFISENLEIIGRAIR